MDNDKKTVVKAEILKRLNELDPELCSNFGITAAKDSKEVFNLGLVTRPELVDTPIAVIIKRDVTALEAVAALKFLAIVIKNANEKALRAEGVKVGKAGGNAATFLKGAFSFPGRALDRLILLIKEIL